MAGPPKDVPAGELWRKLLERPRPSVTVDFPGKGTDGQPLGQVMLWVLTESELHGCRANADKTAKALLGGETRVGDLGYEEIYRNEMLVELVSIACRQPDDSRLPSFPSARYARQQMTSDEIAVLAEAYAEHRRKCGPILSEMTEAEMSAWIERLKEGASKAAPLEYLSPEALKDLCRKMGSMLSTATGSSGSLPDESSVVSASETRATSGDAVDEVERARTQTDE
jgi:hypothetical protein